MPTMLLPCLLIVAQSPLPGRAAPATVSSQEMYDQWCASRSTSTLCERRKLIQQMGQTKELEEKKKIGEKIRALLKSASPQPAFTPGQPRPQSALSKEYQQMKMDYCSKDPPGAKTICSTAASQYKLAGSQSTRPSASSSLAATSALEVWDWYCSRPKQATSETVQICENQKKRASILQQLRSPATAQGSRKPLIDQLKLIPPEPFATTQAVYADFCKAPANAEKTACTRLKATTATNNMRKWYCAQPQSTDSDWCKRSAILEKMQKIPSATTDPTLAAERKALMVQYLEFTRPTGGGPSKLLSISKEISAAKKQYCEQPVNQNLPFCSATRA